MQEVFPSHTNILLSDGVGPAVVSKHLIGQADHTMPFDIANLEVFRAGMETGFPDPAFTVFVTFAHPDLLSVLLQPPGC